MSTTILLVDDSRASRMLCSSVIKSLRPGLVILEAGDAEAALAVLEAHTPDLAVLDMNMPGMSGLELAERIRVTQPDMKLRLCGLAPAVRNLFKLSNLISIFDIRESREDATK